MEIDDKHRFLKSDARVVDLGAAPSGWSRIAAKRVGATDGKGRVVAIDILDMDAIPGVDALLLDFIDPNAPDILEERERGRRKLGGKADIVLSDMAANATGHRKTDHLKIMALVEAAAEFATEILNPGGVFLAEGVAGRHRGRAFKPSETQLFERQTYQAGGQPGRFC